MHMAHYVWQQVIGTLFYSSVVISTHVEEPILVWIGIGFIRLTYTTHAMFGITFKVAFLATY